jgi:serine/threonine protein kinase
LNAVEFQSKHLRIDKKAFQDAPPTAVVAVPRGGQTVFVDPRDDSFRVRLDASGTFAFDLPDALAPAGAGPRDLLLDRGARARDGTFAGRKVGLGLVAKLKHKQSETVCAARRTAADDGLIVRAVDVLRQLRHPNVLGLVGYYGATDEKPAAVLSEWASRGPLSAAIYGAEANPTERMKVVAGIVLGMRYLHARGIMHRDLRPSKILLDKEGSVKIGGVNPGGVFGRGWGSGAYLAPEVGEGQFTEAGDVYAFGIILWEIAKGEEAYKSEKEAGKGPIAVHRQASGGNRPDTSGLWDNMKRLIEKCWNGEQWQRPNFGAIFDELQGENFRFMQDADGDAVRAYVEGVLAQEAQNPRDRIEDTG